MNIQIVHSDKKRKAYISMLSASLIFLINNVSYAAVENLDEMDARKNRLSNAVWGPNYFEDSSTNYKWQPETLMYNDVTTGHEVWRLTNTKNEDNYYHNDISWAQWSANGKWLAFASTRDTNAFNKNTDRIWMLVKTDGSNLMPVIGGSNRTFSSSHEYFHWSPQIPDVYYDTGDRNNGLSLSGADLYKNIVTDSGVSRQLLFSTNQANGNSKIKKLSKTISGDGLKVLLRDSYVSSGPHYLYPCTVYPEDQAGCDWDGYSVDRGQGSTYGDMPESYNREHGGGLYLTGNAALGYHVIISPTGTAVKWRMDLTGSAPDGGPEYSGDGTTGEVIIMSTKTAVFPPWENHHYWSHESPDMWGNHVVISNMEDDNRPGIAHLNIETHEYETRSYLNDYGVQHNDWHGFTDYSVSSYTPYKDNDGLGQRITAQRYNDSTLSDINTICFPHVRENGGSAYSTLARPFISPDGTKVAWTSEFLNSSANRNDIFWCVIRKPKPPINVAASFNGESISLSWQRPAYTSRGWPNDVSDNPPVSKEIKGYHVWVSSNINSQWSEITKGAISMESLSVNQAIGTTRYYAVTSEEYSRLESDTLSEIVRVSISADGVMTSSIVTEEGTKGYWTTPPPSPSDFKVTKQVTAGHYKLTWNEPSDSKIRYYNIYYSLSGEPSINQSNRIASIPVGSSTYIDWLADKVSSGNYRITSVDRYGNEGSAVDAVKPSPPPLRFN